VVPARRLFALSALAGAAANALVLTADGLAGALVWRFATGVCLAGVYPPAMKMIATWFRAGAGSRGHHRRRAHGREGDARTSCTRSRVPGSRLSRSPRPPARSSPRRSCWLGYRDGPYPFPPRPFSWGLVGRIVAERRWRLATGGYLGHMWELYAAWTWLPAFLAASVAARDPAAGARGASAASAVAFAALAVGGLGCVWGGLAADRRGRAWLVTVAMALSALCALAIGLAFGASLWVVAPLALAWGFFVIADSAQFSVLVTESVPPDAVGTALTLQTSLGFLLTSVSIQLVPRLAGALGWRWAFPVLALGPALGIASIRRLQAVGRRAG
jgi:MFS family permease